MGRLTYCKLNTYSAVRLQKLLGIRICYYRKSNSHATGYHLLKGVERVAFLGATRKCLTRSLANCFTSSELLVKGSDKHINVLLDEYPSGSCMFAGTEGAIQDIQYGAYRADITGYPYVMDFIRNAYRDVILTNQNQV